MLRWLAQGGGRHEPNHAQLALMASRGKAIIALRVVA